MVLKKIPDGAHFKAGTKDNAGRWYPWPEYEVPGAFKVRGPSRKWPNSYISHFYTKKYAAMLLKHRPDLYGKLHGIKDGHPDYDQLVQLIITMKLIGKDAAYEQSNIRF